MSIKEWCFFAEKIGIPFDDLGNDKARPSIAMPTSSAGPDAPKLITE
jgi:hypothetical protein